MDATCENCGAPCEYDSEVCLCVECERASRQFFNRVQLGKQSRVLEPWCNWRRFFQIEIDNERQGGVSPATLNSAMDSLTQAPDDIIAEWAEIEVTDAAKFVGAIEALRGCFGGDAELSRFI